MVGIVFGGLLLSCQIGKAEPKPALRPSHPWGRFNPGAWKRVRLQKQTVDAAGEPSTTTTQLTVASLRTADDNGYSLMIRREVEVNGEFVTDTEQEWRGGYCEEVGDETATVVTLGAQKLQINDATIDTEVREIVIQKGDSRRVQRVHYSDQVPPFVLRRVSVPGDQNGSHPVQLAVDVLAVEMPYPVLGELRNVAYVRTVHKADKRTITTVEVHCGDVPGGVVAHSSVSRDEQGRVVERSTLELLGYDTKPDNTRLGLLGRRRAARRD